MTPEERYAEVAARYSQSPRNKGLGADLRSVFDLEGPESLGAMINIPGYDSGLGGGARLNTLMELKRYGLPEYVLNDFLDQTTGSEGLSVPVEDMMFDSDGSFTKGLVREDPTKTLGFTTDAGGQLRTPSGVQFSTEDNLQTIMAELEAARREVKDSGVLPRFDQEIIEGTGEGTANILQRNILESEAAEIDALLGNDPVFDDPMSDVAADLAEIKKDKRIKQELIRNETELSEAQTPPEKKYFDTPGGGGRDAAAMSKEKAENNAEKAFIASMDDFVLAARGENPKGPEKKTIEQYKQEFADATGIDVSGKVDNRLALMAGGLSLLQNKAGKDFNVGKMLKSVGEAGEAAMPELAAARKEAKQAGLSAGKFALEMQSSDESKRKTAAEKAMNRTQYYVMPKGEGVGGFIKNMDKAKSQRLNVFELNALTSNPEFDENFEVISASNYTTIATKAMEAPEAVEYYSSTKTSVNLLGEGSDPIFSFSSFDVNPNVKNGPAYGKLSGGSEAHQPIYRALSSSLKSLNKQDAELAAAVALAEGGAATTPEMIVNWTNGFMNKLGFSATGNTQTDQLQFFLDKLSVENAAEILGESGKTLSDADRGLVKGLIGELKAVGGDNPMEIAAKLRKFREVIIVKKRNDIKNAFRNLDGYARQDTSALWGDGEWSDDDEADLVRRRKKYAAAREASKEGNQIIWTKAKSYNF